MTDLKETWVYAIHDMGHIRTNKILKVAKGMLDRDCKTDPALWVKVADPIRHINRSIIDLRHAVIDNVYYIHIVYAMDGLGAKHTIPILKILENDNYQVHDALFSNLHHILYMDLPQIVTKLDTWVRDYLDDVTVPAKPTFEFSNNLSKMMDTHICEIHKSTTLSMFGHWSGDTYYITIKDTQSRNDPPVLWVPLIKSAGETVKIYDNSCKAITKKLEDVWNRIRGIKIFTLSDFYKEIELLPQVNGSHIEHINF